MVRRFGAAASAGRAGFEVLAQAQITRAAKVASRKESALLNTAYSSCEQKHPKQYTVLGLLFPCKILLLPADMYGMINTVTGKAEHL
jgi:hypothetical protein